jgi:beta-glucosidase
VNFSGCAIGLVPETESCEAILQAWYPGEEGGLAITDVLFGDVNPSGKLPVTFYRSVDDLPDFENYDMKGHTYRYFEGKPLFPFGYGLSYTTFKYGRAKIKNNSIIIPVKNTGKVDGTEVVQVYVRRPSDKNGPSKTLRIFRRVFVPAGKTVKVCLPLEDETFLWWSEEKQDMVPLPGKYRLLYGGNSEALRSKRYTFKK